MTRMKHALARWPIEASRMLQLAHLSTRLAQYRPQRRYASYALRLAAVALIVREHPERGLEVLMIERSHRKGDPWSGHMAFPGGVSERCDVNPLATAWRETKEETSIDLRELRCLGHLSELRTHTRQRGAHASLRIRPYVFSVNLPLSIQLNHEAVDSIWLPLNYLADSANREHMQWRWKGRDVPLPCYHYQEKRVWGLSLQMLDELLEVLGWHQRKALRHPAPR
ncbi:MAG TPA: CoA pyrophosphatase [Pseudomonadales bacterium]